MFIVSILQTPPLSIALCEWYRNAGIVGCCVLVCVDLQCCTYFVSLLQGSFLVSSRHYAFLCIDKP
jgi:hypothetical protein